MPPSDWGDPQNITAIATTIIAIVALYMSYRSIKLSHETIKITKATFEEQQKHDRLSVKPIMDILTLNFPGTLNIRILNGGLGPMIIKSIEIFKDGDVEMRNLQWPPTILSEIRYRYGNLPTVMGRLEECPILNGAYLEIFSYVYDITNKDQVIAGNEIRRALKDLIIKIKFTSVYDIEQFEKSHDLKIFNQEDKI